MRILGDKYAKIGFPCLNCGEHTEQSIEWLRMHDRMYCYACGAAIELTSAQNRLYVHRVSEAASALPVFGPQLVYDGHD